MASDPYIEVSVEQLPNGKFSADINCKICGGPITHSNSYGMMCDKECLKGACKRVQPFFDMLGFTEDVINGFGKPKKSNKPKKSPKKRVQPLFDLVAFTEHVFNKPKKRRKPLAK